MLRFLLRFVAMNLRSVNTFVGFCPVGQLFKCQYCSAYADNRQVHFTGRGGGGGGLLGE